MDAIPLRPPSQSNLLDAPNPLTLNVGASAPHLPPPHVQGSLLRGRAHRLLQPRPAPQGTALRPQAVRHDNPNASLLLRIKVNGSPTRPRHEATAIPSRQGRARSRPDYDTTTSPRALGRLPRSPRRRSHEASHHADRLASLPLRPATTLVKVPNGDARPLRPRPWGAARSSTTHSPQGPAPTGRDLDRPLTTTKREAPPSRFLQDWGHLPRPRGRRPRP